MPLSSRDFRTRKEPAWGTGAGRHPDAGSERVSRMAERGGRPPASESSPPIYPQKSPAHLSDAGVPLSTARTIANVSMYSKWGIHLTDRQETFEQKVARLEYNIDLLRDVIADQEKFIFWDWVIAHRLNEQEVRGSIDKFNEKNKGTPNVHEYQNEIRKINNLESRMSN